MRRKDRMEKLKQCLDEFIVLFLNCIDLYYLPDPSLPCYIPSNAKIQSWPPEGKIIRKWLSKEPLVSVELRGPMDGLQDEKSETNYRIAEDITPEWIDEIIQDFEAMDNPQNALREKRQYEAMYEKLEIELRGIRKKLKVIVEKNNLPEPFTYAVHTEKSAPCYAVDSLDRALQYIIITEEEYKQDRKGCASLKDYLAEQLRKQNDEYLEKWGEKLNSLPSGERRRKSIITVNIKGKDIDLTEKEALCLLACQEAFYKDNFPDIRQSTITMKVWPGETTEKKGSTKYHWKRLRGKLEEKGFELPPFKWKGKYAGYCIDNPPAWLKKAKLPKTLVLPPSTVRANR